MKRHLCKLWLSEEACQVLLLTSFFHNQTIDEAAEGAIMMIPHHEKRTEQIYDMVR
jgi:hypothetical protein